MLTRLLATLGFLLLSTATAEAFEANICASATEAIHEKGFVEIGGIPQWVTIDGDSCTNPVILLVHGGPGNPLSPFAHRMYGAWEKDYTLVQWDQRGAGITYGRNRPSDETPLTFEQITDDGIELIEYLTRRLNKRKVIVMGGSWSSIIAVRMIKARPDLFTAYLGWSQIVNYRDNSIATYNLLLNKAREAGDLDSTAKLEALGAPPWTNPRNFGIMRRIDRRYEAQATDPAPKDWWEPAPEYATPQAEADYTAGEDYSYLQFVGLKGEGMYSKVDLPALGARFDVPVFLLQGEADYLTLPEIARSYFEAIQAPQKAFILLPRTGHDPNQIMLDAQLEVLNERIRPLAE